MPRPPLDVAQVNPTLCDGTRAGKRREGLDLNPNRSHQGRDSSSLETRPQFLIFDILDIRNFVSISSLTGECSAQKLKQLLQFLSMDMFTS